MTSPAILESVREWSGTVPLIGRDDDLAILGARAAEAREGAIVGLLGGDAGMGKSRLVAEHVARAAADGALVLTGGCLELSSGGLPYAPFAEAFRSLRPSELPAFAAEIPELGMRRSRAVRPPAGRRGIGAGCRSDAPARQTARGRPGPHRAPR